MVEASEQYDLEN
jgi:hypothetical protein